MSSVTAILDAISADTRRTPEELLDVALVTAARLEGDAGPLELDRPAADFVYVAQAGDTLDFIAHRRYGAVSAVRHVQAANPELTGLGPRLPAGTQVPTPGHRGEARGRIKARAAMGLRTAAFTVETGDGDVTSAVDDRLVELRITLTSDRASDTLEIVLEDAGGELAVPAGERELRVWLGYRGSGLVPMGVYYPRRVRASARPPPPSRYALLSADFRRRSSLKAPRRRSWDNVSLADLVDTIAGEHGYTGRVPPALADIVIAHIDQTAESDLHLLRRLARQYDATAKAAGGYLIFAPRGRGRSAGTDQALPVLEYAPGQRGAEVMSARYTVRGRPRYSAVVASYHDVSTAELVHVRAGSGTPAYVIREPYPDRPQTEAAAAARLSRFARQTEEVQMSVPGNPALVSEAVLALRDWPHAGVSRWTALRATHTLSKSRGYVTSVTAEPAAS